MQREEAFPVYPPGAFASAARFGRRHWGNVLSNGVLELFDGRLTFTNGTGELVLDADTDTITKLRAHSFAFDFDHDDHRWTAAFIDRGDMGDLRLPPRLPRDVTGPHDLPLFRVDEDMDSIRNVCSRWLAELGH